MLPYPSSISKFSKHSLIVRVCCVAVAVLFLQQAGNVAFAASEPLDTNRILKAYPFRNLEQDLDDMEGGLKILQWGMSLNIGPSANLDPYAFSTYLGRSYYYPTLQANPQMVARLEARFFEIFEVTAGVGYSFFSARTKVMPNAVNKADQYQYLGMTSWFPTAGLRAYLPLWKSLHPFVGGMIKLNQSTFTVSEDFLDSGQAEPRYLSTTYSNLMSWQFEAGAEFPLSRYFGARLAFYYEPMNLNSLPARLVTTPTSAQPNINLYTAFNQVGFSGSFYIQF